MTADHDGNKAPVLLMTYRKAEFLPALHDAILRYAPPRLYLAHNPAADFDSEAVVSAVRSAVAGWRFPFPVEHVFHGEHLGINDSFHRTLDHVFDREDALIILEDDTIPSPSFFDFCNVMLARYRDDETVGSIVGCNLGAADLDGRYFHAPFSVFYWGWATWASRWRQRHATRVPWGSGGAGVIPKLAGGHDFFAGFLGKLDADSVTWDVWWGWVQALNQQTCVVPGVNLVANKGFGPQGTHIRHTRSSFAGLTAGELTVAGLQPVIDAGLNRVYEERTAALIREILAAKGVLARYGLG